jgi:hypothetical protein
MIQMEWGYLDMEIERGELMRDAWNKAANGL